MCEFCEETNFKIVDGYEKGKKHTEIAVRLWNIKTQCYVADIVAN